MKNIYGQLYGINTVSGSNGKAEDFIKEKLSDFCDEIFSDSMGNVYALKKGIGEQPRRKIALVCPFCTQGFITRYIDCDGKILLRYIGEPPYAQLCGMRAVTENGVGGVINCINDEPEDAGADDFYLDIGAISADEVSVLQGEFVSLEDAPELLGNNRLKLGALGRKAVSKVLFDIAFCCGTYNFDLYFIFIAQHLLSARGEICAAYTVRPDTVIALDLLRVNDRQNIADPLLAVRDSGAVSSYVLRQELCCAAESIGVTAECYAEFDKKAPSIMNAFAAYGAECACVGIPAESDGKELYCDVRAISGAAATVCSYLIFEDEKEVDKNDK